MAIAEFSSIGDAVTFNNSKIIGDAGAHLILQASQQLGSHNSRMNSQMETVAAMWANRMATPDPVEAISTQKMLTGNDKIDATTVMGLAQVFTKAAQTTPPVTP